MSVLEVRGLTVRRGRDTIVASVDLRVAAGESIGIVGESGSGKSITAKAITGLLPKGFAASGEIRYGDRDLLTLDERGWRSIRGGEVALIMQDPFTILNPVMRCGRIIEDSLARAEGGRRARRQRALELLAEVGIADPAVADRYPFQLSGGMRQRVAIAAALASDPQLLIADEPSTALDAATQREILALIKRAQQARGMALILITHDLRVAFSACDRINVLYAGSLIESGPSAAFEAEPLHPYSQGLLLAEPPVDRRVLELVAIPGTVPTHDAVADRCPFAPRCSWVTTACHTPPPLTEVSDDHLSACVRLPEIRAEMRALRQRFDHAEPESSAAGRPIAAGGPLAGEGPLVSIADVRKEFRGATALQGVSLEIGAGESVGIVGESGSGKTTLARMLVGLERPTSGEIVIDGVPATDWSSLRDSRRKSLRNIVQIVFQDPYSTLNPTRTVGATLAEAVAVAGDGRVSDLLELVGLPAEYARRRPSALSGGERQRVAIARALAVRPRLLICDEPVSALDVSVQAQILNFLTSLRAEHGLAYLFITHDLAVVRQIADRVVVLRRGRIVESGPTETVLDAPADPYTAELLAAVPGNQKGNNYVHS